MQRKNLTVIEEAQSFKKLMDRGFTQEDIANKLSISQSSIANKIRLLNLPKKVQDALLYNKISERHARSLLSLNDTETQLSLLERIINEKLTVRQTEEEVNKLLNKETKSDIPEGVMKFINNNDDIILEVPDVVEIPSEEDKKENVSNQNNIIQTPKRIENNSGINPFQIQFENNIRKIDEQIKNNDENYYDSIINKDLEKNSIIYNNKEENISHFEEIKEEEKEQKIYIPNLISDIREITKKYNSSKVNIKENNLEDKYQIIIEIKKDE